MKFIKSREKKKILKELEEIYGVEELNYLLIETGKQKLRGFSGSLSKEEILELSEMARIEIIGMYLISRKDKDLRLSFDAVSLFRKQISKKVFEIDKENFEKWIRGFDLEVSCEKGIVVLRFGGNLVGVGKSNGEKIFNYVPKERKLKIPLPKEL